MKLFNFIFTLALLVAVSVLQTACLWDYSNYTCRDITFNGLNGHEIDILSLYENTDIQLYLPIRKEIGHPEFDKFAKLKFVGGSDFNFIIESENNKCFIYDIDIDYPSEIVEQVKNEMPNAECYTHHFYKEISVFDNLQTNEKLSIHSNADIVYRVNQNEQKEILKHKITAKYYLRNKNKTSEISKQKYIELKQQWRAK